MEPEALRSARGKRVATLVGAALAVVLLAAFLLFWKELVVRYHLYFLRTDPSYLQDALLAEPGSLQRAAIERHVKSRKGTKQLLELYLDAFDARIRQVLSGHTRQPILGCILVVNDSFLCRFQYKGAGGGTHGALSASESDRLIRTIVPYLRTLPADRYATERFPGFVLSILPADEASFMMGVFCGFSDGRIKRMKIGDEDRSPPNWLTEKDVETMKSGIALVLTRGRQQ